MRILVFLCGFILLFTGGAACAEMYTTQELAADRTRIVSRIAELHGLLTLPQFLPPEARWLAGAPVETPDVAPNGDPMGFMAVGGRVILPLSGLKFMEDLTMAYAWRYRSGSSLEPIDEYLAMLRWKPEGDWLQGRYLDPLEAFGVPDGAWDEDVALGELGTSLRNEAWAFMLSHELAHVLYDHPGNLVPAAESQANEQAADAFAMDLMERTGTIPMGAILYFQATAVFYASRADLPTDRAYARWQREKATHPVNSQRLMSIARHLYLASRRQENAARRDALAFIADGLENFAQGLDEPAMQQLIARRGVLGNPADLKDR